MGNANDIMPLCVVSNFHQLSSLALDLCPVPGYQPNNNPLLEDMLFSPNASLHLAHRYRDAQNSLSPSELARFTRRLRTTFGREGKVRHAGGPGVVALALALLFDTLAREVKGQWAPRSGPVPGLFAQEPSRNDQRSQLAPVLLVSDYLRLIPDIANNPVRMREEMDAFFPKIQGMRDEYLENLNRTGVSYVDVFNSLKAWYVVLGVYQYDAFLSNSSRNIDLQYDFYLSANQLGGGTSSPLEWKSSFNCNLKEANAAFKQEVLKRGDLREELKRCGVPMKDQTERGGIPDIETVIMALEVNLPKFNTLGEIDKKRPVAPLEDFDLKAKSNLPY